jgi:hypothetical protein
VLELSRLPTQSDMEVRQEAILFRFQPPTTVYPPTSSHEEAKKCLICALLLAALLLALNGPCCVHPPRSPSQLCGVAACPRVCF